jgi:hypothetical protein
VSTESADGNGRPPLLTVALLSSAALAYEILLIRLFSIIQWHHFAYMIISLALLGYGASGTFLSFVQARLLRHYPRALLVNLALFGLTVLPCFLLAQQLPFNPEEMFWNPRQLLLLTAMYLVLSPPFFFAANAIALTLSRFGSCTGRVYAADLLGAGAGSLAVLLLLFVAPPLGGLTTLSVVGLACLPVAMRELGLPRVRITLAVTALPVAGMVWLGTGALLHLSPYKALSQALRVDGAQVIAQRHSPLALLQLVGNGVIPPRYAPGMSLNATAGPPPQLGLYADGNALGAITRDRGERASLQFLDQLTSALPYHLQTPRRVLVAGAGGGMDVLQARWQNAAQIDAVEANPQVAGLLLHDYAAYSGDLYRQPGVHLHIDEVRDFLGGRDVRYDLIQLSLQDSPGAASAGLFALSENYLYTTEALQEYLRHLAPGGYLAVNQWIKLPPRDTLKLFATAIDALQAGGRPQPGERLVLIRGWQTSTLLVKNGAFTAAEIEALRHFCRSRSFDVVWYAGIQPDEVNRYNRLTRAYFHLGAQALLGDGRQAFVDSYKFRLQPATDDRPYFHNFFKWSTLPEILALRGQGGLPLLETGYLVMVATLAQATLVSLALILVPLVFLTRRRTGRPGAALRWRVIACFTTIGLAFMFVEIACIQKFMRFLHYPVYTTAVVLASFLVFAGLGSAWSRRFSARQRYRRGTQWAVGAIALAGAAGLLWLDGLFDCLADWPMAARMLAAGLSVAPLAFFMGLPFPLALGGLGTRAPALLPLAWGVNGCASVLGAVLATLLAIHAGFNAVLLLALALYGLVPVIFPLNDE